MLTSENPAAFCINGDKHLQSNDHFHFNLETIFPVEYYLKKRFYFRLCAFHFHHVIVINTLIVMVIFVI